MKILLIEDEQQVSNFIKQGLEEQEFEVDVAYDGHIGKRLALNNEYHVIVLDIIIPGINGFDLCRMIKDSRPGVPILILTTLGMTDDKVSGFNAGADDYLLKPFDFVELIARLNALTRRSGSTLNYGNILRSDNLQLDMEKKVAVRSGKSIKLSAKEFLLLEYFLRNKGRVISKSELAEKVWDLKFDPGTNVVEVYINMLRNKIDRDFDPKLLHTRIGLGYVLINET
jgi:two-component system copper resistance phosphate regulon response regulator CusR